MLGTFCRNSSIQITIAPIYAEHPHIMGHAVFIDLAHPFATPLPVSTGGTMRADELAYDPADHIILIANDRLHPSGEVDEINPTTRAITRIFPTTCSPAGLALIPGQHLMTSCGNVLDIASGAVVHTVGGVGVDEIWFNSG